MFIEVSKNDNESGPVTDPEISNKPGDAFAGLSFHNAVTQDLEDVVDTFFEVCSAVIARG